MIYGERYIPDQIRLTGRPPIRGGGRPSESKLAPEQQDLIEQMYRDGVAISAVAEALGLGRKQLQGYYGARGWRAK